MKTLERLSVVGAILALGLAGGVASAAEVACPAAGARIFYADSVPAPECWDYNYSSDANDKNVSGNNVNVHRVNGTTFASRTSDPDGRGLQIPTTALLQGQYDLADGAEDNAGSGTGGILKITWDAGGSSGTWEILGPLVGTYYLLLKTGANVVPAWAAFALPAGVTTGSWSIEPGQALSHASLYGQVPLPAAAWLLLSGLAGLFGISRRRKTA